MTVAMGSALRLTTQVRSDGQLIDPASIELVILLPDGTSTTVSPVQDSTGVYHYDYTPTQPGLHIARWLTTGPAGADEEPFDVAAEWAEATFISMADAIEHLKKKGDTPDAEKLRGFVAAACQMITDRMGQVSPVTVTHEVTRCGHTVVLPKRPVIEILSVQTLPGLEAVPPANRVGGVDGWVLDSAEGVVTLTRRYGALRFVYRAGRSPLPPNYRLAGLELIAHLWRTSQLNSGGGRPPVGVDEVIVPGVTYALPYTVRQLLGLDKRPQDEVLVG